MTTWLKCGKIYNFSQNQALFHILANNKHIYVFHDNNLRVKPYHSDGELYFNGFKQQLSPIKQKAHTPTAKSLHLIA